MSVLGRRLHTPVLNELPRDVVQVVPVADADGLQVSLRSIEHLSRTMNKLRTHQRRWLKKRNKRFHVSASLLGARTRKSMCLSMIYSPLLKDSHGRPQQPVAQRLNTTGTLRVSSFILFETKMFNKRNLGGFPAIRVLNRSGRGYIFHVVVHNPGPAKKTVSSDTFLYYVRGVRILCRCMAIKSVQHVS